MHNVLAPIKVILTKMSSVKILLVDDEVRILDGYRRSLHRKFKLDTASSGRQTIELLSQNSNYAVVITDMRMSGMAHSLLSVSTGACKSYR